MKPLKETVEWFVAALVFGFLGVTLKYIGDHYPFEMGAKIVSVVADIGAIVCIAVMFGSFVMTLVEGGYAVRRYFS